MSGKYKFFFEWNFCRALRVRAPALVSAHRRIHEQHIEPTKNDEYRMNIRIYPMVFHFLNSYVFRWILRINHSNLSDMNGSKMNGVKNQTVQIDLTFVDETSTHEKKYGFLVGPICWAVERWVCAFSVVMVWVRFDDFLLLARLTRNQQLVLANSIDIN